MPQHRLKSAVDLALTLRAFREDLTIPAGRTRGSVEAIAVLPFENVSGDPRTEPLSDGIADHLIISLPG